MVFADAEALAAGGAVIETACAEGKEADAVLCVGWPSGGAAPPGEAGCWAAGAGAFAPAPMARHQVARAPALAPFGC